MSSFIKALKASAKHLFTGIAFRERYFAGASWADERRFKARRNRSSHGALTFETLQPRQLLAAIAISDGGWSQSSTWEGGIVPDSSQRAIISSGVTVELDDSIHEAKELVVHGNLVVNEDVNFPEKTLTTRWVHINSGGQFIVGSEADRYDEGDFTLNLTGTDVYSDHVIETNMMGVPGTMNISNNDGFLMTAGMGRIQFFGQDKLSFTKLAETVIAGERTIKVANVIERNYDQGAMNGDDFVTSAGDDGLVNWEEGDQIVIASSSYDYAEEDVREIESIVNNGDGTSTLTLTEALSYRHYGTIEVYGESEEAHPGTTAAANIHEIDLRAEVALLSRNIKIQGDATQDTDDEFGDRANLQTEDRIRSSALAANEPVSPTQVANGVGGHLMFMPSSGRIVVDGVQLEGLGQASQKGRYPIHWHLGQDRPNDVLRNSSITNSNNRGVTIHGTNNLHIEGVVLHDIHGHGFFFEDAVETGNKLVGNIAFGIHLVGGDEGSEGVTDPFVVDTHDNVRQADSRFKSSAAFWITNPNNTFVGNISAGASGTGFWYAIPRVALGGSANLQDINGDLIYAGYNPIYAEFGQFDNNSSHSTPVGLNFDRGSEIEDASPAGTVIPNENSDNYSPRTGSSEGGVPTTNFINGFTNYKSIDTAVYHRGQEDSIFFNGIKVADSYNSVWSVFKTEYADNLYVGHSNGNADLTASVGGPRLYDGAGLYTNTHFAGFGGENAYAFQVEGSSFGPTMYHAFRGTSFENDMTYTNLSHAVSDFPDRSVEQTEHDLGQPSRWIKAALDLDGTLTGAAGGGAGFSIVPNIDFLIDGDDTEPAGWDAALTGDVYTRVRITNDNDGSRLFPDEETGEPLVRFTARDGDFIDVMSGQNNGDNSWVQIAAKTDSDGNVEGTFEVQFMRNGIPPSDFVLHLDNQDGGRSALNPAIQAKVDAARIVVKVVAAGNHTPSNFRGVSEVASEAELRAITEGIAYFRDGEGNLLLNVGIANGWEPIKLTAGDPLQTGFESRTIEYHTTIEAENFDNGIDGIAYHDSDGMNSLGSFRGTGVDADSTKVGDIADGEWLEYTADIVAAGYNIGVNVNSTAASGQIRVLAASSNSAGFLRELGVIDVPDTGEQFETVWLESVDLGFAGGVDSVIRLEFVGGGFEVDSLQFAEPTQESDFDHRITADETNSRIELEEYDNGGQGVAYFDKTAGNDSSDTFRSDEDVDADENSITGKVFEDEWLEYTTDIEAGVYDISLQKIWGSENKGVKLWIANSNSALEFDEVWEFIFAGPEGEQETITIEDIDLTDWAGTNRVLRVEIIGRWMGLDYLEFQSKTQVAPQVDSVIVNDGGAQRSMVSEITVNFSEEIAGIDSSSFVLMNTTTNTQIIPTVTTELLDGRTVAKLTFSGSGIIGGSLSDGNYTLTTLSDTVTDAAGNLLDGDQNGTGGDNAVDSFFRLYGDANGDRIVNVFDLLSFRRAFRGSAADFDYNGDGVVNVLDLLQFRKRFGSTI